MMNEQEFYRSIENTIGAFLPGEYADAKISLSTQVKHNDREKTGLIIRLPDEMVTPVIYLDDFFREYEKGARVDDVLKQIADVRTNQAAPGMERIDPVLFADYDLVKDHLSMRVYDTERNGKRLENIVHHSFGDFSAAYAIVFSDTPEHTMSVMVTPAILEKWGITKKKLHEDTIRSDLAKDPVLMDMDSAMLSVMGEGEEKNYLKQDTPIDMEEVGMPLFCLTNDSKVNGAGLILNSVIQEKIAQVLGGSYYVLPSSIHEVLILPDDGGSRAAELGMMVREINASIVNPDDLLSDKVQVYDAGRGKLVNAAEFEMGREKLVAPARARAI